VEVELNMLWKIGYFHYSGSNNNQSPHRGSRGFTLIEVLVVAAMVLILFSVSLPSLLEAQVRDKVAKAKADIRIIAFAMEEYYRDYKVYPAESESDAIGRSRNSQGLFWLTTPIAYLSQAPVDLFANPFPPEYRPQFYETGGINVPSTDTKFRSCMASWVVFSRGPDEMENEVVSASPHFMTPFDRSVDSYSPTNGTTSLGDIFQYGGDPFWIGVMATLANRSTYRPNMDNALVVDHKTYLHRLPPKLR
jgi:prepilin-type N-terminal cleavage/methylation domain-containing protein